MTVRKSDIEGMVELSEMVFTTKQSHLGTLKARETELRELLAQLKESRLRYVANAPTSKIDPAVIAGADFQWSLWADTRRRSLNMQLANHLVLQEKARDELASAFGRKEVTRKLAQMQKLQKAKNRAKQAEF